MQSRRAKWQHIRLGESSRFLGSSWPEGRCGGGKISVSAERFRRIVSMEILRICQPGNGASVPRWESSSSQEVGFSGCGKIRVSGARVAFGVCTPLQGVCGGMGGLWIGKRSQDERFAWLDAWILTCTGISASWTYRWPEMGSVCAGRREQDALSFGRASGLC